MIPPLWTLEDGVELARKCEAIALRNGYHVAIGGSVLHRGESPKDLDLFFYPHKTEQSPMEDVLIQAMLKDGIFVGMQDRSHVDYDDHKKVFRTSHNDKRVDLFFLQ